MADHGLDIQQQRSLLNFLRVAADGEMAAEQARCRLCEVREFDPYELFKDLQGGALRQRGWLAPSDVMAWLAQQPHALSSIPLEELTTMLAPYLNSNGRLLYDGLLRLVLPRDPAHCWLKDTALGTGAHGAWQPTEDGRVFPEVAYRTCQLLDNEVDLCRHLKFHRKRLADLFIHTDSVAKFLDPEQGGCSCMGAYVSPGTMRRFLVDHLQELSHAQVDALLRRINPSGASFLSLETLGRFLTSQSQSGSALPRLHPTSARARSQDASFAHASVAPASRTYPAPPLQEPHGAERLLSTPARPSSRTSLQAGQDCEATRDRSYLSPSTPTPPFSGNEEQTSGYGAEAACRSCGNTGIDNLTGNPCSCPAGNTDALFDQIDLNRDGVITREEFRKAAHTWSATKLDSQCTPLPERAGTADSYKRMNGMRSAGLNSTVASTRDFMSPQPRSPTPMSGRRTASPHSAGALRTTRAKSATPYPAYPLSYSSPARTASYARPWGAEAKGQLAAEVLRVMHRQAGADVRLEDAKALLPYGLALEGAFATLDRYRKGYISDTDLWQLAQDFGGPTPFGSFVALVNEVQLRRPPSSAAKPGRLSLRELGLLALPLGSRESDAVLHSGNDEEARNLLYILRHSEACPGCGARAQRNADAAGCPTVSCPICGTLFRCFCVVGDAPFDVPNAECPLSWSGRYHLSRLVDTAALIADELEKDRRQLELMPGCDLAGLSSVFNLFAESSGSLQMGDLRRAFFGKGVLIAEQELSLLWRRYKPDGGLGVSFAEFARQLKPLAIP